MLHSPLPPDVTVTDRLQTVIAEWKGALAGHTLARLYQDCLDLVGSDTHLLPVKILPVRDLDSEQLVQALRRYRFPLQHYLEPIGRFDSALVPVLREVGAAGFLFVYEEERSIPDQVALFAHAIGHLLLNHQQLLAEKPLFLDPDDGLVHTDRLATLRYLDRSENRNYLDRQVLDAFPKLAKLVEPPEESDIILRQTTRDLISLLRKQDWVGQFVRTPYRYTHGRVIPNSLQHGKRLAIDALLCAQASLPTAVVHVQRAEEELKDAVGRVRHAAEQLCVPFAYILTLQQDIIELNSLNGNFSEPKLCSAFPTREDLQKRWFSALQLTNKKDQQALCYPFDPTQRPRYYQEAAINQAVIATLQARRGLRARRILLTLATGTGKTQVAFQILWKLKQTYSVRNVLFLADRGYLLDQAQTNTFGPFGDAIVRGSGEIDTAHDILFGTYQWLTNIQDGDERYKGYPSDYFDVIVIDECHRGSADENSNWRQVLAHFSQAVQIGLTATPLETKDVHTNTYFGPSVYTYSLSQGINDGYLAPYSVRRVQIGTATKSPTGETPTQKPLTTPTVETLDQQIVTLAGNIMRQYTQTIAEHLALYLQQQPDPRSQKTIIFCVDNDHAHKMRVALEKACAAWARPGDIVRIVDDDGTEGKRALGDFCAIRETHPVLVTTARLLTTGIDAPTCKNIVLARGVGSIVEFKQIIGRGTRLSEPDKTWFTIIDYAGAIKHFFDRNFDGDPTSIQRESLIPLPSTPASEGDPTTPEPSVPASPEESTEQDTLITPDPKEPLEPEEPSIPQTDTAPGETASPNGTNQESNSAPVVPGIVKETGSQGYESKERDFEEETDRASSIPAETKQSSPEEHPALENTPAHPQSVPDLSNTLQSTSTKTEANGQAVKPVSSPPASDNLPVNSPIHQPQSTAKQPAQTRPDIIIIKENGHQFVIHNETTYELDASGTKLREGTNTSFAQQALKSLINTPDDLRRYWSDTQERKLLIDQLTNDMVGLDALARELKLSAMDHFDILMHILFQQPMLTRQERVQHLLAEHSPFFQRFEHNPQATDLLNTILEKYIQGDAPDVSDIALLSIPPLSKYTRMEWAQVFSQDTPKSNINAVLKELQQLLYQP